MNKFSKVLLSTAYFPPIEYFIAIVNSHTAYIEQYENFQKQSYRNRCEIYGANGKLSLIVPVVKNAKHIPVLDINIDYSKAWVHQHLKALDSSYRSTPFYEYYRDDILEILLSNETSLFNLNIRLTNKIIELLGIETLVNLELTTSFEDESNDKIDFRNSIHPKKPIADDIDAIKKMQPYYQVYSDKYGHILNLSILDLIFNEGPNSISYLMK
ncbi:MAG: WbqC family protein [Bacteroidales bacterium]